MEKKRSPACYLILCAHVQLNRFELAENFIININFIVGSVEWLNKCKNNKKQQEKYGHVLDPTSKIYHFADSKHNFFFKQSQSYKF